MVSWANVFWEIFWEITVQVNTLSRFFEVMVLIFQFKNIFQRNENRFTNLVLQNKTNKQANKQTKKPKKIKREFSRHKFSLNFIWTNSPISFCYFFILLQSLKITVMFVQSSFNVILYLIRKWVKFLIFFYLTFLSLWVALYFTSNLKNMKDHI